MHYLHISLDGWWGESFDRSKHRVKCFYTGMFDFSDDGKKSSLIGFQHQNENLNRDTFLGNLSPITGAIINSW